jgi:hypothetical protein
MGPNVKQKKKGRQITLFDLRVKLKKNKENKNFNKGEIKNKFKV